jgi:hypothetical protein
MIEQSDPTKNKEYSQALAKLYGNGGIRFEDLGSTISDYLTKFHKLKQKKQIPSPRNDFMRYQNIGDFMSVVDEYPDPDSDKQEANRGSAKEYYNDDEIRVIVPEDEAAACYYGQGTRWCTAAKNNNMFNTYNEDGPMYIVIPKHPKHPGEKYQLHFESNQFMDAGDNPVSVSDLVKQYPSMRQAFARQGQEFGMISLMSDEDKDKMAEQGQAYIQAHGVDQGDGIVTVSLNQANAAANELYVDSRVANLVNAASSSHDFGFPTSSEEGDLISAYAIIDTKNKDNTWLVWASIDYDGLITPGQGQYYEQGDVPPKDKQMASIVIRIGKLLELVVDDEYTDFDNEEDPWAKQNQVLADLRQKFGD